MKIIPEPLAFDWDKGNMTKNLNKHNVTVQESEEIFSNEPFILIEDIEHSTSKEQRFKALGKTRSDRKLFVSFTIRENKVRVIPIRNMSKREEVIYESIKKIPEFKSEDEEREFWATHDSTEYVDWSKAQKAVFPNLKSSTESISLRLPSFLLARIKQFANRKDVPYQSLMKMFLSEKVDQELKISK